MTITADTLFKVLGPDREPMHGGRGQWPEPSVWTDPIRRIVPCVNGYHVCRLPDLIDWLGPHLWVVEVRGERIDDDNKIVVGQARLVEHVDAWNSRTALLFAADCAERVLPLYERASPDDDRPRRAIDATRAYARSEISEEDLDATWSATWSAARAAESAAWAATRTAARSAARSASSAERHWQTARLLQYLNGELS